MWRNQRCLQTPTKRIKCVHSMTLLPKRSFDGRHLVVTLSTSEDRVFGAAGQERLTTSIEEIKQKFPGCVPGCIVWCVSARVGDVGSMLQVGDAHEHDHEDREA